MAIFLVLEVWSENYKWKMLGEKFSRLEILDLENLRVVVK
jgi:hypothetical protein